MSTPISPVTPYCTASQFLQRYDVRSIGDRLLDDGTRATPAACVDPTQPAGATLLNLLLQASGMLETALLRGERYSVADLLSIISPSYLTTGQTTTGAQYVVGLVADICLWLVYNRRPMPGALIPKPAELAMKTLDVIADGVRILAFEEVAAAGVTVEVVAPDPSDPMPSPLERQPLTQRTSDYFGNRDAG